MTDLQPLFDEFDSRISLNDTQVQRMTRAWRTLQDFLVEKYDVRTDDVFLQGSFANGTAIEPIEGGEYDIDVICVGVLSNVTSDTALDRLTEVFGNDGNYEPRLAPPKTACVRLEYAEDYVGKFHVDVVPARLSSASDTPLDAPRRKNGWHATAPAEYTDWCRSQGPLFARTVKALKRWRGEQQTVRGAIKSIVLQVLAAEAMPQTPSDAQRLAETFKNLDARLAYETGPPIVANPVLPSENLARRWTAANFEEFREELREAVSLSAKGLSADSVEAIEAWRELLGEDFPAAVAKNFGIRLSSDTHARPVSSEGWSLGLDPRYQIAIRATEQRGRRRPTRRNYSSDGSLLFAGKKLCFKAIISGPRDADVWWQVANTGAHAREESGLRGNFFKAKTLRGRPSADETENWEDTAYTGAHWIRAVLVKSNVVVAQSSRFLVNIHSPRRGFAP